MSEPLSPEQVKAIINQRITENSKMNGVDRYLRIKDVVAQTGLSESTVYRLIRNGEFPAPNQLGPHRVGWKLSRVTEWCDSRPSAR